MENSAQGEAIIYECLVFGFQFFPPGVLMTLLHRVELCPSAEVSSSVGCGSRHLYRDPSLEGTIQYLTVYISVCW